MARNVGRASRDNPDPLPLPIERPLDGQIRQPGGAGYVFGLLGGVERPKCQTNLPRHYAPRPEQATGQTSAGRALFGGDWTGSQAEKADDRLCGRLPSAVGWGKTRMEGTRHAGVEQRNRWREHRECGEKDGRVCCCTGSCAPFVGANQCSVSTARRRPPKRHHHYFIPSVVPNRDMGLGGLLAEMSRCGRPTSSRPPSCLR